MLWNVEAGGCCGCLLPAGELSGASSVRWDCELLTENEHSNGLTHSRLCV